LEGRGFFEGFFEPFKHVLFGYSEEEKERIKENQKKRDKEVKERQEAGESGWYNPAWESGSPLLIVGLILFVILVFK
jgi:hypothetical protein